MYITNNKLYSKKEKIYDNYSLWDESMEYPNDDDLKYILEEIRKDLNFIKQYLILILIIYQTMNF